MKMIIPRGTQPDELLGTDIPEDDTYSAWDAATNYVADDVVYVAADRLRYVASQTSTNLPPADNPDYWTPYGAATRWRPFDGTIARYVERSTSLYYQFQPSALCDGIALFNLAGGEVQIEIENASAETIYDETHKLVDKSGLRNWKDWIAWQPSYRGSLVVTQLPIWPGYKAKTTCTVGSGSDARLGELVIGRTVVLGRSMAGGEFSFDDYSLTERDNTGALDIVEGGYSKNLVYEFLIERGDEERVMELLISRRAKPTVFLTDESHKGIGTTTFGLPVRPRIVYDAGPHSVCRFNVEDVL